MLLRRNIKGRPLISSAGPTPVSTTLAHCARQWELCWDSPFLLECMLLGVGPVGIERQY
jgi:hypothetical protein